MNSDILGLDLPKSVTKTQGIKHKTSIAISNVYNKVDISVQINPYSKDRTVSIKYY